MTRCSFLFSLIPDHLFVSIDYSPSFNGIKNRRKMTWQNVMVGGWRWEMNQRSNSRWWVSNEKSKQLTDHTCSLQVCEERPHLFLQVNNGATFKDSKIHGDGQQICRTFSHKYKWNSWRNASIKMWDVLRFEKSVILLRGIIQIIHENDDYYCQLHPLLSKRGSFWMIFSLSYSQITKRCVPFCPSERKCSPFS